MGDFMQVDYGPDVRGLTVDAEHHSDERHGVLCPHHGHVNYGNDRLLREGNRVTVAVTTDDPDEEYHVEELRCLHCPLSFDVHETVGDYSVYDDQNVIISEATLAPTDEDEGFVLIEPHIICASVSIPGL